MKYCITRNAREKMARARHETGQIPVIKYIALGSEGCDANGNVRIPLDADISLRNELIRREYTSFETVTNGHIYKLKLEADELVGENISEMALVDADGDLVEICNFLPKGKDDTEVEFAMDDIY